MAGEKEVGFVTKADAFVGKVTWLGYEKRPGQTIEEWMDDGDQLVRVDHAMSWALGDWFNAGGEFGEESSQALALELKSEDWWNQVCRVAASVPIENRVEALPWAFHQSVAALDHNEQRKLLRQALDEEWSREQLRAQVALVKNGHPEIEQNNYQDAKEGRAVHNKREEGHHPRQGCKKAAAVTKRQERIDRQERKRAENAARKAAKAKGEKVPPKAVVAEPEVVLYDTLLADPWRDEEATISDVAELPVAGLIADNAIMFMWSSPERLPELMALLETWGFDLRSQLVWRKSKATITPYTRELHKLVLIAKRGNPAMPPERNRPPSVFDAPAPRQGRRPDILFQIIEKMLPSGKRVVVLPTGDLPRAHQDTWHMWNAEPKGKRRAA